MRPVTLILLLTSFALPTIASGAECQPGSVALQVLGSGGPELDDSRASSAYLLWVDGRARVLIDAGAGAAPNYERSSARLNDLDAILFTHLHVDHSVDFPAFIKAAFFSGRERDLPVYGPAGNTLMPATSDFVQRLLGRDGAYRYLSEYVTPGQSAAFHVVSHDVPLQPLTISHYPVATDLRISAIPVHHGAVAALAWRIDVKGCSVSFSGDMSNRNATLAQLAQHSNLLVAHNAIPEGLGGVARRLHMPPSEIGSIAAQAEVGALLLSHRMRRSLGQEPQTRRAIRSHYDGPVDFANDMDCFELATGQRIGSTHCDSGDGHARNVAASTP